MTFIKLFKGLFFKLLILAIVILIASKVFDKNKIEKKEKKIIQKIAQTKKPKRKKIKENEKDLNLLVEKLNAHIDEQTYLLSHYLEQDIDEEKIKKLYNNLIDIKKDAKNKKVAHLVDMQQLQDLQHQIKLYDQSLKQKNKNL